MPLPPEPEPRQVKLPGPRGGPGYYHRLTKVGFVASGSRLAWSVGFFPDAHDVTQVPGAARPLTEW